MIIVYRIANRELTNYITQADVEKAVKDANLSFSELFNSEKTEVLADVVYELHKAHASKNGGRLLFTTRRGTTKVPTEIILMSENNQEGIYGTLKDFGKYSSKDPDDNYTVPLLWDQENVYVEQESNFAWFEIENVKIIDNKQLRSYTAMIDNKPVPITNCPIHSPFYAN
ncbi:TPA: hypothetical protein U1243_000120 [Streptococcus suis]|nr:hypothetical protein [Streptococcus suis]HEM5099149.1 hypothetical protein [Streptococcus suis]HEM5113816.1 hypothetical protein [Streptococcus suis]